MKNSLPNSAKSELTRSVKRKADNQILLKIENKIFGIKDSLNTVYRFIGLLD